MADTSALEQIETVVDGVEVDVLVCNHMFTPPDTPRILDMPLDVHRRMIDINSRGYADLIHRFGNRCALGHGVRSSSSHPEALWFELLGSGVDVLVMVGGLMNTQGDLFDKYPQWLISEPHAVVRRVFTAVGRKHMLVPSVPNRLFLLAQTPLMSRRRAVLSIEWSSSGSSTRCRAAAESRPSSKAANNWYPRCTSARSCFCLPAAPPSMASMYMGPLV
jgi:short-subunit dehydrogenase